MTFEDITLNEKEGIRRNSIASVSSLEKGKKEEEFLWKEGLVLSGDRVLEEVVSYFSGDALIAPQLYISSG